MGFYGNITNTSKTTFSFDKTYPNRYEADLGCKTDNIMSGRYILIEYDADQTEDSYNSYYCYGAKMYRGVNADTLADGTRIIKNPQKDLLYETPVTGEIVRVPIGQRCSDLNNAVEYITITNTDGSFQYITQNAYQSYLESVYQLVMITSKDYTPGKFYFRNDKYDPLLNTTLTTYTQEKAYPTVTEEDGLEAVSASMLVAHADNVNNNGVRAKCKENQVYWVYVDEDAMYAPIGLIGQTYYSYIDKDNKVSWEDWWEATDSRKKLLSKATSTANLDTITYYYKSIFNDKKDYYLPLNEIYREVTNFVNDGNYQANTYYWHEGLKQEDEVNLFTTNFKLSEDDDYVPGRRYFDNGLDIEAYLSNDHIVFTNVVKPGDCIKVGRNHIYSTNEITEFWMYTGTTWKQLTAKVDSIGVTSSPTTFLTNFAIDMGEYGTSRGYDSTVWQKIFTNGEEKYVMIAELNSVVPTFDIGADAPSQLPLVPHFDADSTNVYYKLHWQPNWGLRVKAANYALKGPAFTQTGAINGSQMANLRRQPSENDDGDATITDSTFYPSDEDMQLYSRQYNTATGILSQGYYSSETESWDAAAGEEGTDIPAAIYYNKDGFDSTNIAYSNDYFDEKSERYIADVANSGWDNQDKIELTPTGQSGHLYNTHGNTTDQEVQPDIQELSIMLPSIGNTIATMWDLVYGGRDTNDVIKKSNERNLDIEWEDAKATLDRRGLRLVNDNGTEKQNTYSRAEINTIAGAINSAHDMMGMIISEGTTANLANNLANLDEGRIYFNSETGKYYRKHLTYDFVDLKEQDYVYTVATVTEDDWDPSNLWIKNGSTYTKVSEADNYQKGTTYYYQTGEIYDPMNFDSFNPSDYYYMDYTSSVWDAQAVKHPEMMNYSRSDLYQPGHKYCKIDKNKLKYCELVDAYKPGRYFYADKDGNFVLDYNDEPTDGRIYYVINKDKVISVINNPNAGSYTGIYVPNYYYYQDAEGNIIKDTASSMTKSRVYLLPTVQELPGDQEYDDDGNPIKKPDEYIKTYTYVRVPDTLDQETYEYNQQTALNSGLTSFYFTKEETGYESYNGSWSEYSKNKPEIYSREESYSIVEEDKKYTIDDMTAQKLVQFKTNTFYFELKTSKGVVYGYQPVEKIQVNPLSKTQQFVAFGYGVYPAGTVHNGTYYTLDTAKEWADDGQPFAVKGGVNFNDVEEWALKTLNNFYVSSVYHYMDENENIILDTYKKMTHENYFTIPTEAIVFVDVEKMIADMTFYEPYKYYRKGTSGEYYKATEDTKVSDVIYYERKQIYVKNDTRGIYPEGTVWSANAISVPTGVTLATHKERWELKEIPGFARNVNTMHGLLLKLNHYMEYDDKYTRDERVGNGLLNQLHDIIAHIGKLVPRKIVSIDDTGRMIETDWDTRQSSTATLSKTGSLLRSVQGDKFAEVSSVAQMRKQWLTMHLDGNETEPTLTIHHNFQPVTNTTSTLNKNGNGDTIDLYTPIVDDMGHVVGKNTNTVTLPYGFKTAAIASQSAALTDITANTTSIVADNTQDTITLASGNKWIKFAGNADTDTLTIGHEVHAFTSGAANTQYGLTANKTIADLDTSNQFIVPTFKFDEAGHILMAEDHTITLPENFSNVAVTTSTSVSDSASGTAGTIAADSLTDTITFAEGNKWINITADPTNDKITIGHYVKAFAMTTSTRDLNDGKTFAVISDGTYDEAGHITKLNACEFILPYGFKTISTLNNGYNNSNLGTANENNIVATTPIDTLRLDNSNQWIVLSAGTNNTISIGHTGAGSAVTTKGPSNGATLQFGSSFKVPTIGIDNAGHVSSLVDYDIKLPSLSLTNGTGNVVTGLSLNTTSGAITETKANIGTLLLSGYTPLKDIDATNKGDKATVNDSDSINKAFAKLQARITVNEATHANDYTLLSNAMPIITLDDDGILHITNGIGTNYTINNITYESEFLYKDAINDDDKEYMTVEQLVQKVADLESRIAELEK